MKINTLGIILMLLSLPNAISVFYFEAKAVRMRNGKLFVVMTSAVSAVSLLLQHSGVISNTAHLFFMFGFMILALMIFTKKGRFKALQFALLLWMSEVLLEAVYYVIGYLVLGRHMLILVNDMRYAVWIKLTMDVACFLVEYVLYKLWMKKIEKLDIRFNGSIIIFGAVQIVFMFIAICLNYYNVTNQGATMIMLVAVVFSFIFNFMQYIFINVNLKSQQELWKKELWKKELWKKELLSAQLEKQEIRGRELEETVQEAYEVRCDIAENIALAGRLLEEREGQQAKDKLQGLVDNISLKYMYSNNKIADAVLADKAKLCGEYGIRLDGRLELPDNIPLTGARLCVVLANILDNAIRACRKMSDAKPSDVEKTPLYIKLSAKEQAGFLIIRQENSFDGVIEDRRNGVFSEHGLGLGIVRSIAEEMGGMLVTEQKDNIYITNVGVKL